MKILVRVLCLFMALASLSLCLVSCGGPEKYDAGKTGKGTDLKMDKVIAEINSMKVSDFGECKKGSSDYVLIKVKDYGEIVIVLREDIAPITVKNFKNLVKSGFYSGTIFHRVMEGFMIQGGGYTEQNGALREKAASSIRGEFSDNYISNNLKHVKGVISMARTNDPNSASSQFFIMHADTQSLDGKYAAFGYVLAGLEVVDAIATCEVAGDANAPKPVKTVVIESATFVQPVAE